MVTAEPKVDECKSLEGGLRFRAVHRRLGRWVLRTSNQHEVDSPPLPPSAPARVGASIQPEGFLRTSTRPAFINPPPSPCPPPPVPLFPHPPAPPPRVYMSVHHAGTSDLGPNACCHGPECLLSTTLLPGEARGMAGGPDAAGCGRGALQCHHAGMA
jgi:hypothetical protein